MSSSKHSVLILGASSDIGLAFVRKIEKTLPNCLLYLTKYSMRNRISRLSKEEYTLDLRDDLALKEFCKAVPDMNITHFISLQGKGMAEDNLENFDIDAYRFINKVNLESNLLILSELLKKMKTNCFGRIVLTATASIKHGGGLNSFTYGLSKQGLDFLTVHLAKYYTRYNILSNCVLPGFIDTKIHTLSMGRSKEQIEERKKSIRLGRPGKEEEVADLLYFLAFENTFISGQSIKIDGADFI